MDKIIIKDLEIYGFHGVHEEEKRMGQKFMISAELFLDLKEAGQKDDLQTSVSYAQVCLDLEKAFLNTKFNLIEKAAETLCETVLLNYPRIEKIKLTLKKPWAPIGRMVEYAAVEIERGWHTAYIALGSNLGDKLQNLEQAIAIINKAPHNKVINVSKWYETEPVGYLEQDLFLNGALELKTLLTPKELIQFLLDIEKQLGRERTIANGPRTIDLDVLLYDECITSFEEIIVPHPRMHERAFVLLPLNDIAPYKMHPILNQRICQILKDLQA
ncbi:MAG: 2-amino-4-hydroxy-6-hydroxymethyldihydropteridine diphosphokinase [Vallitaleaceae bacterium]|nr:2-amino-4-hydroxy-6-hydroxymethyldihydropteridine diphosphokinase [Vallitaleaceae bacterium]